MLTIISTSLLALFFAWLGQTKRIKNGLILSFLILVLVSGIRYYVGTDYGNYYDGFERITTPTFSWKHVWGGYYNAEPGWILLNYLFVYIGGFYGLIAAISVIEGIIYYYLIEKHVPRPYWTFSCFIFIFTADYFYLMNMTMLRQGLAVALCFLAYDQTKERKYIYTVCLLIIAFLIHKTALFFIPFIFIERVKNYNTKLIAIILVLIYGGLWMSKDFMQSTVLNVVSLDEFELYQKHLDGEEGHLGLGFLIKSIPFFVSLFILFFNSVRVSKEMMPIVLIACIGWTIQPFGIVVPLVLRFCIYFMAFSIISIPYVYGLIDNKLIRYILIFIFITINSFVYINFFGESSIYHDGFATYQTIFDK